MKHILARIFQSTNGNSDSNFGFLGKFHLSPFFSQILDISGVVRKKKIKIKEIFKKHYYDNKFAIKIIKKIREIILSTYKIGNSELIIFNFLSIKTCLPNTPKKIPRVESLNCYRFKICRQNFILLFEANLTG